MLNRDDINLPTSLLSERNRLNKPAGRRRKQRRGRIKRSDRSKQNVTQKLRDTTNTPTASKDTQSELIFETISGEKLCPIMTLIMAIKTCRRG
jgi:hypothetical protein